MKEIVVNLAFAGTPEFAEVALLALLNAGYDISLVLTQPDRPAGRGMKLHASPVKAAAIDAGLRLLQPSSLKNGDQAAQAINTLRVCNRDAPPDVLVVAAYGLILPQQVLDIPRLGCLNIHASLLPRWRGAAPIHRAIEAGDTETGITIMQMDSGLDTGAMRLIKPTQINPFETTATLHDRLAVLGGQAIVEALALLEQGGLPLIPQPSEGVTYAQKIDKNEAWVDWGESADDLARRLRAFDPFPGASARVVSGHLNSELSTQHTSQQIKLWSARAVAVNQRDVPGKILSVTVDGVLVQCGRGHLLVTELQKPGGKRQHVRDSWRHLGIHAGDQLMSTPGA